MPNNYQAPAVLKAFELLKAVAESRKDLGLSDLAKNLGFSKSTTYGLTQALLKIGALEMCPRRQKFFIGPAIIDLGIKSWNFKRVAEKTQSFLNSLRDIIDESVVLGAFTHSRAVVISTAEAAKPLKISSPPGTSIPSLSGAVGKIFLSQMDDARAAEYIDEKGLPFFTPKTIVKKDDYLAELRHVREVGYALDDEEYMTNVKAIAVGLGNHRGLPLALWIVGFSSSMSDEKIDDFLDDIFRTVSKLKDVLDSY